MSKEDHYRKLERMYIDAPINTIYKPTIEVRDSESVITIESDKKYFHAAGAVHGSVYFKMLDDAAFFAANSLVEEVFVLTSSFNIHLLRPVIYGPLRAVGKVVFQTRKSLLAESILYNVKDKELARGSGTFIKSTIALNDDLGYK